jgi:hypothetical protein
MENEVVTSKIMLGGLGAAGVFVCWQLLQYPIHWVT